jgi:hypothetical protein
MRDCNDFAYQLEEQRSCGKIIQEQRKKERNKTKPGG